MDGQPLRVTARAACAAEQLGAFGPGDWPELATQLLVEGYDDPEIVELASLVPPVDGWSTDPIIERVRDRLGIGLIEVDEAAALLAQALADDLRLRPATVTSPMVRMLARLAPPAFESQLANECYGVEEYLDCDCVANVDMALEAKLETLPSLELPDNLIEVLARPLRQKLPLTQPPHSH